MTDNERTDMKTCEIDGEVVSDHGEQYWHCDHRAITRCCGTWLCGEHLEDHLAEADPSLSVHQWWLADEW